jgi:hypothetical protein
MCLIKIIVRLIDACKTNKKQIFIKKNYVIIISIKLNYI